MSAPAIPAMSMAEMADEVSAILSLSQPLRAGNEVVVTIAFSPEHRARLLAIHRALSAMAPHAAEILALLKAAKEQAAA